MKAEERHINFSDRDHQKVERVYWGVSALTTMIATGAAIFAAVFAYKAYHAASDQATYARDSVDATRESFTSTQRAFVTISEIKSKKQDGTALGPDGKPLTETYWYFTPEIENSGSTPTKDLKWISIMSCGPTRWLQGGQEVSRCTSTAPSRFGPDDPDDQRFGIGIARPRALLGPHAKTSIGGAGVLPGFLEQFGKAGYHWYLYGSVHYRDIFKGTPSHITKFCYEITGDNADVTVLKPVISLCAHWNCADEECDADKNEYFRDLAEEAMRLKPKP